LFHVEQLWIAVLLEENKCLIFNNMPGILNLLFDKFRRSSQRLKPPFLDASRHD